MRLLATAMAMWRVVSPSNSRHESPSLGRQLTWEDFRNSFGILGIDAEKTAGSTGTLRAFLERRIAKLRS